MSKTWGTIGAWAAEAEREEAEERELAAAAAAAGGGDSRSFPSLKEAANTKQKKKKMSLQEFTMQTSVGGVGQRGTTLDYKGLTPDEIMRLPTGPKERSADEMHYGRLGAGFSNYGRSGGVPGRGMRDREGEGDSSWGGGRRSYGGFDDDRRAPPPRASDFDQPSRADEVDNWAMTKKPLPFYDSGRSNRYGSLGGGVGGGGMSRADEIDNWAAGKKPIPARSSTFGSSFRNSGPEPDRLARGWFRELEMERPKLVLDPPRGDANVVEPPFPKTNKPNPFGAARPREEVLAEKGMDWKKLDIEIEAKKTSRPTSSQSSRPSSAQSSRSESSALQGTEGAPRPRPKVNPFGDAKPREEGMDWRKIDLDLEHRSIHRPETDAEKNLKDEIKLLREELEKESASKTNQESEFLGVSGEQTSLHDLILNKEKELQLLIRDFDDKVRFGQKALEGQGSGPSRVSGFPDRLPSQSGRSEELRNRDFEERPRSRGAGDSSTRQGNERRSFHRGRERGFLGNRDMDRTSSRERW